MVFGGVWVLESPFAEHEQLARLLGGLAWPLLTHTVHTL